MALNTSGTISIGGTTAGQSINLELGRAATASSNLNETALRTLAGVPSGTISLDDFHGKSSSTDDTTTMYVGAYAILIKSCSLLGYGYWPSPCSGSAGTLADTTVYGATIISIYYATATHQVGITLAGNQTKSLFSEMTIGGGSVYTSALTDLGTNPSLPTAPCRYYNTTTGYTYYQWTGTSDVLGMTAAYQTNVTLTFKE